MSGGEKMKLKRISCKGLYESACTNVPCGNCGFPFNVDRGYIWVKKKDGERICYNCARNYYIVRREELRQSIPRKNLLEKTNNTLTLCKESCVICERTFDANLDYIWEHKEGGYICYKCAESAVLYRQQYGFWLRGLMSEHFIPCEECQDKLHEMMMTMTVAFHSQDCITIETLKKKGKLEWQFLLRFLTCGSLSEKEVFKPCGKCQKKLHNLWETKELHIGSEIKPVVELWRRMNQVV